MPSTTTTAKKTPAKRASRAKVKAKDVEPQDPGFTEDRDLDASDVETGARHVQDEQEQTGDEPNIVAPQPQTTEYVEVAHALEQAGEPVPTFEEWLAGAEVPTSGQAKAVVDAAEALLSGDPDQQPVDHTGTTLADAAAAVTPGDPRPEPRIPEGTVLSVGEIDDLKDSGHRSPARCWGTGLEQARQAVTWGYDGIVWPTTLAPDAGEEDWQAAQAERAALTAVPQHDRTAVHEAVNRVEERTSPAKKPVEVGDSPGVAKVVAAAAAAQVDSVTLDWSAAELSLAQVTLGRFGYRAFDSWGDLVVPFDYAEGKALPEAPTLTGKQGEQLSKALVDHAAWLAKAKKADADRVAAVAALSTKLDALLAG